MPELNIFQKAYYGYGLVLAPQTTRKKLDSLPMSTIGQPSALSQRIYDMAAHIVGTDAYEIDILARTIWGEARGEGITGMQAVANVIVNRAKQKKTLFGTSISSVCLKKAQFSCWNPKYGYGKGQKGYDDIVKNYNLMIKANKTTPYFVQAYDIATKAVYNKLADITGGADHYFAKSISTPDWAKGKKLTAIGSHYFLNA